MPESPKFDCVEFHDSGKIKEYTEKYSLNHKIVISSDAHYLQDVNEADNFFLLDDEPYSSARVRKELFRVLRGEEK